MASGGVAGSERAALCDLLDEVGPDAATLCAGWTTAELTAHLFIREQRPLAAPGIVVKPLAGVANRAMSQALQRFGYRGLVDKVRGGPPLFMRPLDGVVNTTEYFIHHEDVRRAVAGWEPREDAELDSALWGALRRAARMLARGVKGAGLELCRPDGQRVVARSGSPVAVLRGGPQELALYLYGRGAVAQVAIEGDEAARPALERARFAV